MNWPQNLFRTGSASADWDYLQHSLEVSKSAFQARAVPFPGTWVPLSLFSPASQLPGIIRMLFGYMSLPAASNAEKHFSSAQTTRHSRSFHANPKNENLAQPSPGWVPLLWSVQQWRRKNVVKQATLQNPGERILLRRYDNWQGLVSLETFVINCNTLTCAIALTRVAQLVGHRRSEAKHCRLDSRSGHRLGLQVCPGPGAFKWQQTGVSLSHWCFSSSVSLSLPL